MLLDARAQRRDSTVDTDVCIIGAGAAGIALALELTNRPFRVCLLESGAFEPDDATQSLYRGVNVGRKYFRLDLPRSRYFGGSTNCWYGLCRPLDEADFLERDWIPHSGWPFDRSHLLPYYERAQSICRLGRFAYEGSDWASPERPLLPLSANRVSTRVLQIAPIRFGEVYRDEVTRAENVTTYLYANAVEIEVRDGAVERVRVACLDDNRFWVRPTLVILAAGGIENARLLLASNRVQAAGLGNQHDLVGRFFMEHPHLNEEIFLPSVESSRLALYRSHQREGVTILGFLRLSSGTLERERMAGVACWLLGRGSGSAFERALGGAIADFDAGDEAPARREAGPPEVQLVTTECEQVPNPESRVKLFYERDALGMNRVRLRWRLSPFDKRSFRRGLEILAQELGRAGIGRLKLTLSEDDTLWPEHMIGGRHHMGTTRMHADPKRGVVDANCRVHGIPNLFVAGSSVFPTAGASNPTLTIVALAVRLADHVKGILE